MNPVFAMVGTMPYPAIQKMFDGMLPPGLQWYWRADFFNELGAEVRKIHRGIRIEDTDTTFADASLSDHRCGSTHAKKDKTAWAYRDAKYAGVIVGVDPDPANAEKITEWCKDYWEALHPYSAGGAYLNFIQDEGQDRIKASYKDNYERLTKIKRKYDPDNFFRVNQNILPSETD